MGMIQLLIINYHYLLFSYYLLSIRRTCTDFLSFLAPCEYPTASAAGDGTTSDTNYLAHGRHVHCL